jgi:hypothetical protein
MNVDCIQCFKQTSFCFVDMTGPRGRNGSSRGTTRGRTRGSGSQSRPLSQPTPMGLHQLLDDADGSQPQRGLHPHPEVAAGGGSEPQNPPSTHNIVADPSLSHPSTPDSIGTSTSQPSQQTPFYSTEVFPHIIRRVKVGPRKELYHNGKKVIRLATDEHT